MTTYNWFGGNGRFSAAQHWSPRGVPGSGDTAVVADGTITLQRQSVDATTLLGGPDPETAPTLNLHSASLGGLTMPHDLPQQPYSTTTSPTQYAAVSVWGHSSIGAISLGDMANMVRAPSPYGHGPLIAPDVLDINLNGHATLDTGFDVKEGSTLTVNGGSGSSFNAANSTVEGGRVVLNAPLGGQGTIYMTNGTVVYYGNADAGTLELGGSVGAGNTVDIRIGNLLIDKPLEFAGAIDIRASQADPAKPYSDYGAQSVTLKDITATSYGFDDLTHTMTLFNGDSAVDQLRFTPDIVAGSFSSDYSGIGVDQTAGGVLLRGKYVGDPNGSTHIPVRT